jgi:long-chain fatty acid omega-monooxygenase
MRCSFQWGTNGHHVTFSLVSQIKHDILSRFIELGEAGGEDGGSFGDDKSLRDVVLNFVIAGRDTTATTLSWFTYMTMANPEVAEKLIRELCAFEAERAREEGIALVPCGGDDDETFAARVAQFASLLSYDSLGKLVYLHACVTETLRLYPAVPQVSSCAWSPPTQDTALVMMSDY